LVYQGVRLPRGYRADLVVEGSVIIEIKSVEHILPVHVSQILTYLRLGGYRIGLLLNFNTKLLKDGLHRFVL
jgi:GxxExxY protein